MNETQPQAEVDRYLERLDRALVGLPSGTALEIRDGIAEELSVLDPTSVHERIVQLGDPAQIAAEAKAQSMPESGEGVAARRSVAYVIATGAVIGFGGVVVPLIGWLVGLAMLWVSPVWHRWEKVVAPAASVLVAGISYLTVSGIAQGQATSVAAVVSVALGTAAVLFGLANILIALWLVLVGLRRVR